MTNEEQNLIDAISKKPGHQVHPGRNGGSVQVVVTKPNGVRIQSVWLGRRLTIETLQAILAS